MSYFFFSCYSIPSQTPNEGTYLWWVVVTIDRLTFTNTHCMWPRTGIQMCRNFGISKIKKKRVWDWNLNTCGFNIQYGYFNYNTTMQIHNTLRVYICFIKEMSRTIESEERGKKYKRLVFQQTLRSQAEGTKNTQT